MVKTSTIALGAAAVWLYYRYKNGPRGRNAVTDPNDPGSHFVRPSMGLSLPPAPIDAVFNGSPAMVASGGGVTAAFKYQPQSFGVARALDSPMFPRPVNANPAQRGATGPNVLAGSGIDPSTRNNIDFNNP